MARAFASASTQYLEYGTAIITAYPFTMACWFNSTSSTLAQTLMGLSDTAGSLNYWLLSAAGTTAGDPVLVGARGGGGQNNAVTSTGYTAGAWHHAAGVFTSATLRDAYIDGGNSGTNTTSTTPSGLDNTTIGLSHISTLALPMAGRIAEAAMWDVALDAAEVAALADGASPLFVRPGNLAAYWPLIGRYDPEIDLMGAAPMTLVNGPTVGDHPRIYYPSAPLATWDYTAAPPAGGRIWRLAGIGGGLVGPRGGLVGHA